MESPSGIVVLGGNAMKEILQNIDWSQVIYTVWTVVLLPVLTYVGTQINQYEKSKKIDKYTEILHKCVVAAVKDVYECIVKDVKGTESWTAEKKNEVREIAKNKTLYALPNAAYRILTTANKNFDEYLDSLIGTALYDLKNKK